MTREDALNILKNYEINHHEPKFRYMLLDRMRQDCLYYLGHGNRNKKNLWALDEKEQINIMKALYNSFPDEDKPEWITMEDIETFEKQMVI